MSYPDDENGAVLQSMADDGVDLVSPRVVDFEHVFDDERSATDFLRAASGTVLDAHLRSPDPREGTGWEVQCRQRMVPTHAAITETEARLAAIARTFGGQPDGWGTMSNEDGSPAE